MGGKGGNLPKFRSGRDLENGSENAAYLNFFVFVLSLGFFAFVIYSWFCFS